MRRRSWRRCLCGLLCYFAIFYMCLLRTGSMASRVARRGAQINATPSPTQRAGWFRDAAASVLRRLGFFVPSSSEILPAVCSSSNKVAKHFAPNTLFFQNKAQNKAFGLFRECENPDNQLLKGHKTRIRMAGYFTFKALALAVLLGALINRPDALTSYSSHPSSEIQEPDITNVQSDPLPPNRSRIASSGRQPAISFRRPPSTLYFPPGNRRRWQWHYCFRHQQ